MLFYVNSFILVKHFFSSSLVRKAFLSTSHYAKNPLAKSAIYSALDGGWYAGIGAGPPAGMMQAHEHVVAGEIGEAHIAISPVEHCMPVGGLIPSAAVGGYWQN